jgi:hypothetical protein
MGKKSEQSELWSVSIYASTQSRHVLMEFVVLAPDGETACKIIDHEYCNELKNMEIESTIYQPLGKKSLFIVWDDIK